MAGPERDLQLLAQKAITAFRNDSGTYRAGYLTHDVKVSEGFVEVTPYHYDGTTKITGGAMALRTGTITMGDTSIDGPVATTLVNGITETTRGAAIETITNREDGIEQAWRFDSAPLADGDLVVSVSVVGQTFVADTATGLHFKSPTALGFRYSDATWVDAKGTTWPIDARYVDGQIVMTVPEDIVKSSTFPAVLDPTVTAEVAVDAPVNGGTGTGANQAAIASDGTNYLVVWSDRRLSTDADIFGTRISPSGTILDADGILIGSGPGIQTHPTVTFAGGTYVVAWEDFKVTDGTESDIVAARVSSAGAVTQLGTIAGTTTSETEPALGSAGGTGLLTWTVGAANIQGAIFNGTTFGAPFNVAASANVEIQSAVAGAPGTGFLVAWSEGAQTDANLRGSIVTTGGSVGAAFDISAAANRQFDPTVAFNGTNFMVAWSNNNGGLNIFGTRVTTAGAVLDTRVENTLTVGGVPVTTAADSQEQPKIACTAATCLVVWRERRNFATASFDIFGQRLNPDFTLAGGELQIATANQAQQAPAVATDGSNFFSVWHDSRDARIQTVFGSAVSAAGAVGANLRLVTGNNREFNPAVGHAGNTHVVAWTDSRSNDSTDVMFVRFNGLTKLDANALTLNGSANAQFAPAISSSGGTQMFAIWSDTRSGVDADLFMTKINTDGSVTSAAGTPLAQAAGDQLTPAVAVSNPGGTAAGAALVVWQDRRGTSFDIMGALLDASGNIIKNDIVICDAAGDQNRPAVAFDTNNQQWVVVWSDGRVNTDFDIFGARIDATGTVLDANGVLVSGGATGSQFTPSLAFTGGIFLAVWQDRRSDGEGDIFGARIQAGASLNVLDPSGFGIGGTTGAQSSPTVAQNVGSFLVAWQDGRNAATTGSDIFGIGIGTTGAVGEPEFVISAGPENETTPALGDSSAAKVSRIAYVKERPDLQTVRVVSRQITVSATTGSLCSTDAQCGTGGFCVDSRCCESACGGNAIDCQSCKSTLTGQPDGVCAPTLLGKVCRPYADTFCDRQEKCDGVNITCPDDIGRRQGIACTTSVGGTGVCPPDDVTGAPHVCQ
ncbi:MAG TPA: hypothetical protein VFQ53_09360 [Kofleriaceae bacterium]|nr:hypothetical protein [Kofleriaceae bacterium]